MDLLAIWVAQLVMTAKTHVQKAAAQVSQYLLMNSSRLLSEYEDQNLLMCAISPDLRRWCCQLFDLQPVRSSVGVHGAVPGLQHGIPDKRGKATHAVAHCKV